MADGVAARGDATEAASVSAAELAPEIVTIAETSLIAEATVPSPVAGALVIPELSGISVVREPPADQGYVLVTLGTPPQLRRALAIVARWVVAGGVLLAVALVAGPPIVLAVAGGGALVVAVTALWQLAHQLAAGNLPAALAQIATLDAAGRLGLACGGYCALLFAVMTLFGGLRAEGRRRLYLVPGILLSALALALALIGTVLTLPLVARAGLAAPLAIVLALYVFCDTVLLGALLADSHARARSAPASRVAQAVGTARPMSL